MSADRGWVLLVDDRGEQSCMEFSEGKGYRQMCCLKEVEMVEMNDELYLGKCKECGITFKLSKKQ